MLKRRLIRRYLLALLCSEDVTQGPVCEKGPLFTNCDGTPAEVYDSTTHQVDEDSHSEWSINQMCAALVVRIESESATISATCLRNNSIRFEIDIIAAANEGFKRQEILDQIQCRVYYRLFHGPDIKDAESGEILKSVLCMANRNTIQVTVRDDSSFYGDYTIRTLSFTLEVEECIKKTTCEDEPLCFDFKDLTVLDKDA